MQVDYTVWFLGRFLCFWANVLVVRLFTIHSQEAILQFIHEIKLAYAESDVLVSVSQKVSIASNKLTLTIIGAGWRARRCISR